MSRPLRVCAGTPVVIDSSVAFKWFDATEHGAGVAAELLREHQRDATALIAPALLAPEVINTLVCRGATAAAIEQAIGFLGDVDLLVAPIDDALLGAAARIARTERLALYDATFVALAAWLDAELVTADRRQAQTGSCRVRLIG
jgi:predicted nucleic acid-binding protein